MDNPYITGQLVDCFNQSIRPVRMILRNGRISAIEELPNHPQNTQLPYLLPGFVDAHVHIESSMLVPSEFARLAVVHGTVATVSDPHEIANVCGIEGIEFMIENGKTVPFSFNFGAPSCVPATCFETAGAALDSDAVRTILERPEIKYLSEMMNFPGALHGDPEVIKKINAAKSLGKPVDGHAPGLRGEPARNYINLGISTDHECFTLDEALEKISYGMQIIIREGSAARNFDALNSLVDSHPEMVMFCSDDKHPDSLVEGHINQLCARSIKNGRNLFNTLRAACINPVVHYGLDLGLLRNGDRADFILVEDLISFHVLETWINGQCVAANGKTWISSSSPLTKNKLIPNRFDCRPVEQTELRVPAEPGKPYPWPVIKAIDGQLITTKGKSEPLRIDDSWCSNPQTDVLKIAVVNRYTSAPIAIAFIQNFNLKQGAIASSVAHDSHNIVAIGVDDESLARAINLVVQHKGGVSCIKENLEMVVPLPVAGLMSMDDGYRVAELYTLIDQAAKEAGSTLRAPFMTLSFMALLVIPHLKLSDKGLFDGDDFCLLR